MAFWNKNSDPKKTSEKPQPADLGRNDPCRCGSGRKYKKCCMEKDQASERETLEETWAKAAELAKEQAEKNAKETKETPSGPSKRASNQPPAQQRHAKFVPSQTSLPRKSGGS
ncbi:MAG: hypothetical protein A2992_03105 [Elusimicrobia bacterium RIFCSPLOWO2_01_FULL_59_12]|nr:MAG: hypothetical protein A2992_03105 [Elusimicrobia bacterium RIFCSPLOWO2_01_FULL_59_12]